MRELFRGFIDEIRIYNRALAPGEIQADMNTPIGILEWTVPGPGVTREERTR
jgi:hypothetical protein